MLRSTVLACVLAGGCYLRPDALHNPTPSPEGVAIRLVGQDCEDHRGDKGEPVTRDSSASSCASTTRPTAR